MSTLNYELISEILFTNDQVFDFVDIDKAKILSCICKNANLNKNIKLSIDRFKAREYFDKIFDIITNFLMYTKKTAYLVREDIIEDDDDSISYIRENDDDSMCCVRITSQLDTIIKDLKKENENVIDGFRELIVLEFKEYIHNYENCKGDNYDIQYNLDYCDQYFHIVEYFGYYEYYESHIYDPTHFILTPDKMDYDFVKKL
jgi:hypothetical protein